MKISFDLDGVIAEGHHWFFRLINCLATINHEESRQAELDYYSSRTLKYHPNLFLAEDDKGFIITARKSHSRNITYRWLERYGISLPIFFIDGVDEIDWSDYPKASELSGKRKADVIEQLGVDVHFDNNPTLVATLRKCLPGVKSILIGGER